MDTRLLFPFLRYLKTDPVTVDYKTFVRGCGGVFSFVVLPLIYLWFFRNIVFLRRNSDRFNCVTERMEQVLKEQIELDEINELLENSDEREDGSTEVAENDQSTSENDDATIETELTDAANGDTQITTQ